VVPAAPHHPAQAGYTSPNLCPEALMDTTLGSWKSLQPPPAGFQRRLPTTPPSSWATFSMPQTCASNTPTCDDGAKKPCGAVNNCRTAVHSAQSTCCRVIRNEPWSHPCPAVPLATLAAVPGCSVKLLQPACSIAMLTDIMQEQPAHLPRPAAPTT